MSSRSRQTFGKRLPGIEGLRAFAASAVLVYHVYSYAAPSGGPPDLGAVGGLFPKLALGVTLFFCLSGFLLYRPFAAAALRGGPRPGVGRYLANRALRIVPAYWCILALVGLVFGAAVLPGHRVGYLVSDPGLLASNLLLVQNLTPPTAHTGIVPTWSLGVEVVFYLALPLLGLLAGAVARRARTDRGRRLAVILPPGLLLLVGLTGRLAFPVLTGSTRVTGPQTWSYVLHQSFWSQADLFSFGMLVAVLGVEREDGRLRLPRRWRLAVVAGIVASVACEFAVRRLYPPLSGTLWGAAFAGLLALVVVHDRARPPRLTTALEARPLVGLGLVSYSVFLWNDPVVLWMGHHGLTMDGVAGFAANLAMVGAVSLLLSILTYRLVELPALRWKRPARTRADAALAEAGREAAP